MTKVKKERKCPKGHVECPQCDGGWKLVEEDGRMVEDVCYHCGNTGFIPDEQAYMNRVRGVAGKLAIAVVMRLKKGADSNPDGEGWSFHAAENMQTEHEYTTIRVWEYEERMMRVLQGMYDTERHLLDALVDAVDSPEPEPAPEPVKEVVQPAPPPKTYTDDDIPF
jgi:hypothetical protein